VLFGAYTVLNLIRLHVKWLLLLSDFKKKSPQIFEKPSNIKIHENPSSGTPVVPRWQTDGQTWQSLRFAYRNFSNAPKSRPGRCDTSDVLTGLTVKICWFGTKVSEQLPALTTFKTTHPSPPNIWYPHTARHNVASLHAVLRLSSLGPQDQHYNSRRTGSFIGGFKWSGLWCFVVGDCLEYMRNC
jgi:hypothetical protein